MLCYISGADNNPVMRLCQAKKAGGKKESSSGGWFGGWFGWGSKETTTPSESKSVSEWLQFDSH